MPWYFRRRGIGYFRGNMDDIVRANVRDGRLIASAPPAAPPVPNFALPIARLLPDASTSHTVASRHAARAAYANEGYGAFLHNWIEGLRALRIDEFVVVALDRAVVAQLTARGLERHM
eukprot:4026516-Prymnesium_polylepis.1